MGRPHYTAAAKADLLEIGLYIGQENVDAAMKVLAELDAACEMLADNPSAGRLREDLAGQLRSFSVGNYLVFYRATEGGILVHRLLHGARDLPELL